MKYLSLFLSLFSAVIFMSTQTASAAAYMIRDAGGKIYVTDILPRGNARFTILKRYGARPGKAPYSSPRHWNMSFSGRYDAMIYNAAGRFGLDPMLIKSVIKVESDFQRFSVSPKGARGLMQLMPNTAKQMKVYNIFDPWQNIAGGSKYLKRMLKRFKGNTRLALAAYNAGPTAVKRYGGVPPYKETVRYIQKVFTAYKSLTGKPAWSKRFAKRTVKKSRYKTVVYTYKSRDGHKFYSDRVDGKRKIITY